MPMEDEEEESLTNRIDQTVFDVIGQKLWFFGKNFQILSTLTTINIYSAIIVHHNIELMIA